jgi:two-component system response regulator AtoC
MVSDFGCSKRGFGEGVRDAGARNSPHMPENFASRRVLVVDDEPLIRWSLAETFEARGYEVVEAGDGRGALLAIGDRSGAFDVVLLDFRLPDSNDLNLLATLRVLAPATPIILMTAFGTPEVAEQALELGAFRVVSKPFAVSDIAMLVQQAQHRRP